MRLKTKIKIISILSILLFLVLRIYYSSCDIMIELARADFQMHMSNAVYITLSEEDKESFKDICLIKFNESGNVTYIGVDGFKANYLSYNLALKVYDRYSVYAKKGVDIPIGAFTGIKMLSGIGNTVNIQMITISSVKCIFETRFESVGINQTMEYLYLIVEPSIRIITKGKTFEEKENIEILCYNNLIVGEVPKVYLQNSAVASEYY